MPLLLQLVQQEATWVKYECWHELQYNLESMMVELTEQPMQQMVYTHSGQQHHKASCGRLYSYVVIYISDNGFVEEMLVVVCCSYGDINLSALHHHQHGKLSGLQ